MRKIWSIHASYPLNSFVGFANNTILSSDDCSAMGSYASIRAIASFQRRSWIAQNGYNAIRIIRNPHDRSLTYTVCAHFGMRAYTLLTIDPIEITSYPNIYTVLANPIAYISYDPAMPVLIKTDHFLIEVNRDSPADSYCKNLDSLSPTERDDLNRAEIVTYRGEYYYSKSPKLTQAAITHYRLAFPGTVVYQD